MGQDEVMKVFKERPSSLLTCKQIHSFIVSEQGVNISIDSVKTSVRRLNGSFLEQKKGYSEERGGQYGYFYRLKEEKE